MIRPLRASDGISMRAQNVFALLVSIIVLGYCLFSEIRIVHDTAEYLSLAVNRPPLYPLLMKFFQGLFGRNGLFCVVLFQTVLVLAAAFYLSHILSRSFKIPSYLFFIVHFLLVSPLLPTHRLYGGIFGNIGNTIASEGLAYGLFTFSLALLIKGIFIPSRRNILLLSLLCVLNVLTRVQMLFMYPIIIVLLLLQWRKNGNRKALLINTTLALLMIAIGFAMDRAYHQYKSGAGTSFASGSYDLLAAVMFVSVPADAEAIQDPNDRKLVRQMLQSLADHKALLRYHRDEGLSPGMYHLRHFTGTIIPERDRIFIETHKLSATDYDGKYLGLAALSVRVLPPLLKKNWFEYVRLVVIIFLDCFTFREGLFLGVFLMLSPWRTKSELDMVFMICLAMVLLNRFILFHSGHLIDRMLFYTDNFQQVVLIVLLGTWNKTQCTGNRSKHDNIES
jgi:hypothetical protein